MEAKSRAGSSAPARMSSIRRCRCSANRSSGRISSTSGFSEFTFCAEGESRARCQSAEHAPAAPRPRRPSPASLARSSARAARQGRSPLCVSCEARKGKAWRALERRRDARAVPDSSSKRCAASAHPSVTRKSITRRLSASWATGRVREGERCGGAAVSAPSAPPRRRSASPTPPARKKASTARPTRQPAWQRRRERPSRTALTFTPGSRRARGWWQATRRRRRKAVQCVRKTRDARARARTQTRTARSIAPPLALPSRVVRAARTAHAQAFV